MDWVKAFTSRFFILAAFLVLPLFAQDDAAARDAQIRFENRLNELMVWRLSDELELKPLEEQKLKLILKKYQEQRKAALLNQEDSLGKMTTSLKQTPVKVCDTCLTDFEKAVLSMADANSKEVKELKALLGPAKMQKFLVIRSQMTKDVREALRQPAAPLPTK